MKQILFALCILELLSCRTSQPPLKTYADEDPQLVAWHQEGKKLLAEIEATSDSLKKDSMATQALAILDQAIQKDSAFYYAYFTKSQIYDRTGRVALAASTFDELLKQHKYPDGFVQVGNLYEELGDTLLAKERYKQALISYDSVLASPYATKDDSLRQILFFDYLSMSNMEDVDDQGRIKRYREMVEKNIQKAYEEFQKGL